MTQEQRPYYELANEIVSQAIHDYYRVLVDNQIYSNGRYIPISRTKLEKFFRSQWFGVLSDLDPDYLMARIQKQAAQKKGLAKTRGRYQRKTSD